ncbi:tRNA (5-methylaminomethyl-2-thiouridine)(34)-methyltransferase MnmD [Aquifex pyrophilus]
MNRETFLEKYLKNFLKRKEIKLNEEAFNTILRELKRFAYNPFGEGVNPAPTADGSYTLIHNKYGEPYHSQTAGAIREAYWKFVKPSRILEKAKKKEVIKILDIGFGLGYNLAVALKHLWDINPSLKVEIISFEKELIKDIPILPEPYREIHKRIISAVPEHEDERLKIKVYIGDARKEIKKVEFNADAVFHDAFSPYKNPELWTCDFLKLIKERIDEKGYWVSYSSSLSVRKSLILLGFKVGSSKEVGRKRKGTVASLKAPVPPMEEEELRKLALSPFAKPMRDENLSKEPLEILIEYLLKVYNYLPQ